MKGTKVLLVAAAAAMLCGMLRECRDDAACEEERLLLVDTLVYVDTVRYYMPVAKDSAVIRYVTMRLPVAPVGSSPSAPTSDFLSEPRASASGPSASASAGGVKGMQCDSVDVEVPIISRHYADSSYEAWVSGPVDPRLDSINVFARRELVTIKQTHVKSRRFNVGIQAGFGFSPHGPEPYIGVGLCYSLFSF